MAPLPEEVVRGVEANESTDTIRHMAGRVNEAAGGRWAPCTRTGPGLR
jgi:hypothetical protein